MPNDFPDWQRAGITRVIVGSINVGPNTTSPVNNFVLPIGTLAVAFQANTQPSPPNNVTITGHTTGNVYFNGSPGSLFTSRFIDPSIDPSIDVTITSPAALGSFVTFMAVEVPENVFVRNSTGEPIPVQGPAVSLLGRVLLVDSNNTPLFGIGGGGGPLRITPVDQSARILFPTNAISLNLVIAAGATTVVIAAVAGQFLFLRGLIAGTTGFTLSLQDTAGTEWGSLAAGANFGTEIPDSALALGTGMQIKNLGGGNSTINGSVFFRQEA